MRSPHKNPRMPGMRGDRWHLLQVRRQAPRGHELSRSGRGDPDRHLGLRKPGSGSSARAVAFPRTPPYPACVTPAKARRVTAPGPPVAEGAGGSGSERGRFDGRPNTGLAVVTLLLVQAWGFVLGGRCLQRLAGGVDAVAPTAIGDGITHFHARDDGQLAGSVGVTCELGLSPGCPGLGRAPIRPTRPPASREGREAARCRHAA
jgi:hypothetical protein